MSDVVQQAHEALLADDAAVTRLHELRGWTREAIETLGIGLSKGRVLLPVADKDGRLANLMSYQPNPERREGRPKMSGTPGAARDLFPAPESLDPAATVWLVEGEPDAVSVTSTGLAGIGIPGSNGWSAEMPERFDGRDVVICCDCDKPGRSLAARVADDLLAHAKTVRVIDLAPARDDAYDVGDLVKEGADDPAGVRMLLERLADNAPVHVALADRPPSPRLNVGDWRKALTDYLRGSSEPAWPIPFKSLNEAMDGGIRPGEVWILAGYTSHGKSIYADMLADECAAAGAKVHLYLTEMTIVQRGLRLLARRTGIPFRALRRRDLDARQLAEAETEIALMKYGATVVTDWTPQQVATDIRVTGTNVAIIDLLHGFHYTDERELSAMVNAFAASATTDAGGAGSGSAVILVCHLNDAQMRDARSPARPKPGMHSLKGASSIKQRADTVMFVWLQDDDDGMPTDDGEVWIAKARNGSLERQKVQLNRRRLEFEEAA